MHEITAILGGRKQGMTHKAIKEYIDQGRKMSGTFKGQGISTNTIYRLLTRTEIQTKGHLKRGESYKRATEEAWYIYAKKKLQVSAIERTAKQIKDPEERKRFMKFARQQTERSKGRQYELEVGYEAETDEYYVVSN